MHRLRLASLIAALSCAGVLYLAPAQNAPTPVDAYVPPSTCAGCHRAIWDSYRKTGMGRAFARPSAATVATGAYWHAPSQSHFTILERDGRFYQRRHQLDANRRETNVLEKSIDYVMGSGNHARTFLHRTARGSLVELPLGWYALDGGYLAMNPGYDTPDHEDLRRKISYECMFCHNGYPRIPAGHQQPFAEPVYLEPMPEGIDCQRCHGPGRQHVTLAARAGAQSNVESAAVRAAIVNPARLSRERREEVCIQCHLETTSFPLPNSIARYDRGPFDFQPGQPLGRSWLFFDHAPGTGRDDKFEIVNAVYRMRKSACFVRSRGAMECATCHHPHDVPRGEAARRHYDAACRNCHPDSAVAAKHPQAVPHTDGCAGCHMPKRRTEDVVHAIATDHLIQRKPAGGLTAPRPERHEKGETAWRGEVVLYYPTPASPADELYVSLAQVVENSNLAAGIPRLRAALLREPTARAEFHLALAEALRNTGQRAQALPSYREAVRRNPRSPFLLRKFGMALREASQLPQSLQTLRQAAVLAPRDPLNWHEIGLSYRALNDPLQARAAFEKAIALDPDLPAPHGNLGALLLAAGDTSQAEVQLREAIRLQPNYADAHDNLANLLAAGGVFEAARPHFETALRLRPNDARTHYNFAMALGRARLYQTAREHLELAVRHGPDLLEARLLLADLLMASGQPREALPHLREALRIDPASPRANLNLALALLSVGERSDAVPHLRKAAASADPAVRETAREALRQFGQ